MRLTQLGTGAAERIPAIFCKCEVCANAMKKRGKEVRTQAQALVNDDLLIDFGGDSYNHFLRDGLPFADITDLLITHWHSDHFYGEDLAYRMGGYGQDIDTQMTVYGTQTVQEFYQRAFDLEQHEDPSRLRFQVVKGGDRFSVVDGKYQVYAFDARHGHQKGDCIFYAITDGTSSALYMHDTGWPTQEAWQQLTDAGLVFDYVTMDCTSGTMEGPIGIHMSLSENARVKDRLLELGLATNDTTFVANHFSHNNQSTHEQLVQAAGPLGLTVAYDGMVTDF